jgi:isoquinoline 1-oxidoreductase beta subunit
VVFRRIKRIDHHRGASLGDGTGIRTVLPMVAADEMAADWKRKVVAIGDSRRPEPTDRIIGTYDALRHAGDGARDGGAAAAMGVPPMECSARNHEVVPGASGRVLGFGALVAGAQRQPLPPKDEVVLNPPQDFRYIGKGVPIVDLDDICTGRATYGFDARLPTLVYAMIARWPVIGGSLRAYDDTDARSVAGVNADVGHPAGEAALRVPGARWRRGDRRQHLGRAPGQAKAQGRVGSGDNASYDSDAYKQSLYATARSPQKVVRNRGDVDAEFARAATTLEASYYVPLLSQSPMEPPAALAQYSDGKVEIWASTQNPQAVQDTVATALGIAKQAVVCHVTLLGGGFGRKSKPDYVAEAAILSKATGRPVMVTWTREDDIRFGYYNAVDAMYLKAALGVDGKPIAWLQRSVFPPITSLFDVNAEYGDAGHLGQGFLDVPFDVPNLRAENGPAKAHVRITDASMRTLLRLRDPVVPRRVALPPRSATGWSTSSTRSGHRGRSTCLRGDAHRQP